MKSPLFTPDDVHLEIPHVDEAVEGALGHDGPLADHGQAVHYRVLPAVFVTLG